MASDASAIATPVAPRTLRAGLSRLRRRARLLLAVRFGSLTLAITAGAGAAAVVVLRLADMWYPPLLPEVVMGASVLAAALVCLLWHLPDRVIATSADRRLGLKDRLGSAVEFLARGAPSGMERAAVSDAADYVRRSRANEAYPLGFYRGAKAAGLCLAALLLAQTLPIPPLLVSPRAREERAALRREASKIEPLARKLEEAAKRDDNAEAAQLSHRLRELARKLDQGKLDKKQALLEVKKLDEDLAQFERKLGPPPVKTAGEAAEELQSAARESIASKAMELARKTAQSGDRQAAEEFKQLAERAKQAATPSELSDLAKELGERAARAGLPLNLPPELAALLSQAFADLDMDLSDQALEELAKTAETWSSNLSAEEMARLAVELEALAKSLEGTDLSELAKSLREAAECLRAGDCESAARCLGKGCELCRGKLARVNLAAICRSCRGGLCGLCGARSGSGAGLGIGPDRGTQKAIPPNSPAAALYAPRSTETSGSLAPVRAQVRLQGPMLATTVKGAPSKLTESRVPYYQVISDYSKAAEEALSREDVPSSYRSTVQAYFDALQPGSAPRESPPK